MNVLLKSGRINMKSILEPTHKNPLGKWERNVDKEERYHSVVLASNQRRRKGEQVICVRALVLVLEKRVRSWS